MNSGKWVIEMSAIQGQVQQYSDILVRKGLIDKLPLMLFFFSRSKVIYATVCLSSVTFGVN